MDDQKTNPSHTRNPLLGVSFVRTAGFEMDWKALGLDSGDDLLTLETAIANNPVAGAVVQGTGGLRKLRFAPVKWRVGKSGALRVCYAFYPEFAYVAMIAVYAKAAQENLSAAEKKAIAGLLLTIEVQVAAWHRGGKAKGARP